MIVLVDDEHRENEGDLVIAAEKATPEAINFMITHGLRHPLPGHVRGDLRPAAPATRMAGRQRRRRMGTAVHASSSTPAPASHTGTSAFDRARTVAGRRRRPLRRPPTWSAARATWTACAPSAGGVLVRAGHTEGSVDLARLAGFKEAAVICEILNADGRMARLPDLREFCKQHGLKMCTIEDLIKYRRQRERLIRRELALKLPTTLRRVRPVRLHVAGRSRAAPGPDAWAASASRSDGVVPVQDEPVLVRIHSQCLTGDMLDSLLCDCGSQLHQAMAQVAEAGKGVVLYMRQEGRGIGLLHKLRAYKLQQEEGLDTVEANQRLGFGAGPAALRHRRADPARPRRPPDPAADEQPEKVVGLDGYGLRIVERVPIQVPPERDNRRYLQTKKDKLGHLLDWIDGEAAGGVTRRRGRKRERRRFGRRSRFRRRRAAVALAIAAGGPSWGGASRSQGVRFGTCRHHLPLVIRQGGCFVARRDRRLLLPARPAEFLGDRSVSSVPGRRAGSGRCCTPSPSVGVLVCADEEDLDRPVPHDRRAETPSLGAGRRQEKFDRGRLGRSLARRRLCAAGGGSPSTRRSGSIDARRARPCASSASRRASPDRLGLQFGQQPAELGPLVGRLVNARSVQHDLPVARPGLGRPTPCVEQRRLPPALPASGPGS